MPSWCVRERSRRYDSPVAEFVVGVVVGVSVTALLFIIVGPSRRVRAERPLSDDDETEILMGHVPGTGNAPQTPPIAQPGEYGTGELQALRRLGSTPGKRRPLS